MSALAVVTRPTDGDTDDRELVARVRAGDDRGFELLFGRYQPRIAAYVRAMVRDHGRAEDITQEVFISALRRMRAETEREIVFKPWIFEIAKNKCIDAFRRTRNASEVSFDARDAIGADEHGRLAEPGATPDSAVEGKIAIDNLCGAFVGLSSVHHDILVLRELEGLSYREIGDRLGMSRAAVESTLFRARKRLTEEYEEIVSGERCLRVQRIVDASGGRAAGRRDQRRMGRHLAYCQPCRRYAGRAGIALETVARPAAGAARIAAFLPLPAFLRRRWGGDDGAPLLGHGGSLSQWSANVATVVDPAVASSWAKAVAAAATVAVAGMGAGAAFTDRAPLDPFGASQAQLKQSASRPPGGQVDALAASGAAKRGAQGTQSVRVGRPVQPRAAQPAPVGRRRGRMPAAPGGSPSQPASQSDRPFGSDSGLPTVFGGAVASGAQRALEPERPAERVLDTVVRAPGEPDAAGSRPIGTTTPDPSQLSHGSEAPATGTVVDEAMTGTPDPAAADASAATIQAGVSSAMSGVVAAKTTTLNSLG